MYAHGYGCAQVPYGMNRRKTSRFSAGRMSIVATFGISVGSRLLVLPSVVHPLLANLVWIPWILLWPLIIAGFLGMIAEAITYRVVLYETITRQSEAFAQ